MARWVGQKIRNGAARVQDWAVRGKDVALRALQKLGEVTRTAAGYARELVAGAWHFTGPFRYWISTPFRMAFGTTAGLATMLIFGGKVVFVLALPWMIYLLVSGQLVKVDRRPAVEGKVSETKVIETEVEEDGTVTQTEVTKVVPTTVTEPVEPVSEATTQSVEPTATEPVEPVSEANVVTETVTETNSVQVEADALAEAIKAAITTIAAEAPTMTVTETVTQTPVEPVVETPVEPVVSEDDVEEPIEPEVVAELKEPEIAPNVIPESQVTVFRKVSKKGQAEDGVPEGLQNSDILVLAEPQLGQNETIVLTERVAQLSRQLDNARSKNQRSEVSGKLYLASHRLLSSQLRMSELKKQHREEQNETWGKEKANELFNWSAVERGMAREDQEIVKLLEAADMLAAKILEKRTDGAAPVMSGKKSKK